jgi:PhnB protein
MAFRPYLAFAGNCREAFTTYQQIFGGELNLLSFADEPGGPSGDVRPDGVMHVALVAPDAVLMGADDPNGNFDGNVRGMCVNVSLPDPAEVKRVFDALSEGGTVQQPVIETYFSPAFGMCIDRFGTPWMMMVDPSTVHS